MVDIVKLLTDADWMKKEPATSAELQELVKNAITGLPEEYLAFLAYSDGGEGKIILDAGWFQIWPSSEVLDQNKGYEIDKNLPGFFGFGSNGGGELLAFDTHKGEKWKIVMVPFVPMSAEEAVVIADNFEEFIRAIGRGD